MYNWIVKRPETAAAIHEAVSAGACKTPSQAADIAAKNGDEIFWTGTIPGKDAETIDAAVADILREIGIPARILGYQYVQEAIKLTVGDMSLTHSMTKTLYPATAEKFNTTTCRVERAIRHAIEAAWTRCKGISAIPFLPQKGGPQTANLSLWLQTISLGRGGVIT